MESYVAFKQKHELHKRVSESERIRTQHPDRIPVIVEPAEKCTLSIIDKNKYLVPKDISVGQFVYIIRKKINLSPEEGLFIFVNNILPPTSTSLIDIYGEHRDVDGFLYITYAGENTFG